MLVPIIIRLLIIIFFICAQINVVKSCSLLKSEILLEFDRIPALTMLYIATPIVLFILSVVSLIIYGITLIGIIDIAVIGSFAYFLIYLVFVENKMTEEGISIKLHGAYSWEDVNKIEITNKHMIVYYQIKFPIIHFFINSFRVKLNKDTLDDIADTILDYEINKKIIYIKS